jgi:hypothetical protein
MRPEGSSIATCPDDEMLAALIENRISGDQREQLEPHVAGCSTCLDVVAATLPTPVRMVSDDEKPERPAKGESTEPRTRSSIRWRRWAMAAGMLIAVGGLLLAKPQRPIGETVTPLLARLGTKLIGVPLRASSGAVRLGDRAATFVITLNQVRIGHDPQARISVDEIRVTVALAALLTGGSLVTQLRVTRPDGNLTVRDLGEIVPSKAQRAKVLALLTTMRRIDVVDARIVLPGPSGVPLAMEPLTGGMERTESGARLVLQGRVAGGVIDVVGTLAGENQDLALAIGGRGLDATVLPVLGGCLRGVADLQVDVSTVGDTSRMDGRVAVRRGRVAGHRPFDLLHLDAASRDILAGLDSTLAGGDLPFDDARAIFAWHDGTWRLPRIFVTTGGVIAGGRARVTARGELSGHGTLRVPAEIVAALRPHQPLLASYRDGSGAATLPFGIAGRLDAPEFMLVRP